MRVKDTLPQFAVELAQLLAASKRPWLAEQLDTLELASRCGCGNGFCSTFYVSGGRSPLTDEQQKDRGPHWRDSLDVDAKEGMVVVDLDRIDRVIAVPMSRRSLRLHWNGCGVPSNFRMQPRALRAAADTERSATPMKR